MEERFDLTIQYLVFGAKMGKLVEIEYKYLDDGDYKFKRYGFIQPIKWLEGRKGIHILAWDAKEHNWRRFAVENIERVHVTDEDWVNKTLTEQVSHFAH
jgi:predicted DNA-binding transcriptional regulator YafY